MFKISAFSLIALPLATFAQPATPFPALPDSGAGTALLPGEGAGGWKVDHQLGAPLGDPASQANSPYAAPLISGPAIANLFDPPNLFVNESASSVFVRVQLPARKYPVEIEFKTADGAALAGVDYVTTHTTLLVQPSVSTLDLEIGLLDSPQTGAIRDFYLDLREAHLGALSDAWHRQRIYILETTSRPAWLRFAETARREYAGQESWVGVGVLYGTAPIKNRLAEIQGVPQPEAQAKGNLLVACGTAECPCDVPPGMEEGHSIAVGDYDGDGFDDVVAARTATPGGGSLAYAFLRFGNQAANFRERAACLTFENDGVAFATWASPTQRFIVVRSAQLDADPEMEIVLGAYNAQALLPPDQEVGVVVRYDWEQGDFVGRIMASGGQIGYYMATGDVAGDDGLSEVMTAPPPGVFPHFWSIISPAASVTGVVYSPSWQVLKAMTAADLNGDGIAEIVAAHLNDALGLQVYHRENPSSWSTSAQDNIPNRDLIPGFGNEIHAYLPKGRVLADDMSLFISATGIGSIGGGTAYRYDSNTSILSDLFSVRGTSLSYGTGISDFNGSGKDNPVLAAPNRGVLRPGLIVLKPEAQGATLNFVATRGVMDPLTASQAIEHIYETSDSSAWARHLEGSFDFNGDRAADLVAAAEGVGKPISLLLGTRTTADTARRLTFPTGAESIPPLDFGVAARVTLDFEDRPMADGVFNSVEVTSLNLAPSSYGGNKMWFVQSFHGTVPYPNTAHRFSDDTRRSARMFIKAERSKILPEDTPQFDILPLILIDSRPTEKGFPTRILGATRTGGNASRMYLAEISAQRFANVDIYSRFVFVIPRFKSSAAKLDIDKSPELFNISELEEGKWDFYVSSSDGLWHLIHSATVSAGGSLSIPRTNSSTELLALAGGGATWTLLRPSVPRVGFSMLGEISQRTLPPVADELVVDSSTAVSSKYATVGDGRLTTSSQVPSALRHYSTNGEWFTRARVFAEYGAANLSANSLAPVRAVASYISASFLPDATGPNISRPPVVNNNRRAAVKYLMGISTFASALSGGDYYARDEYVAAVGNAIAEGSTPLSSVVGVEDHLLIGNASSLTSNHLRVDQAPLAPIRFNSRRYASSGYLVPEGSRASQQVWGNGRMRFGSYVDSAISAQYDSMISGAVNVINSISLRVGLWLDTGNISDRGSGFQGSLSALQYQAIHLRTIGGDCPVIVSNQLLIRPQDGQVGKPTRLAAISPPALNSTDFDAPPEQHANSLNEDKTIIGDGVSDPRLTDFRADGMFVGGLFCLSAVVRPDLASDSPPMLPLPERVGMVSYSSLTETDTPILQVSVLDGGGQPVWAEVEFESGLPSGGDLEKRLEVTCFDANTEVVSVSGVGWSSMPSSVWWRRVPHGLDGESETPWQEGVAKTSTTTLTTYHLPGVLTLPGLDRRAAAPDQLVEVLAIYRQGPIELPVGTAFRLSHGGCQ